MNKDDSVKVLEKHIEKLSKDRTNLIKYIEDKINITNEMLCNSKDLNEIEIFNTLKDITLSIYKDLMKRVINNDYK